MKVSFFFELSSMPPSLTDFIRAQPKAELHLHIEGSLEPERMFELARCDRVSLPYALVEEVRAAFVSEADKQGWLDEWNTFQRGRYGAQ